VYTPLLTLLYPIVWLVNLIANGMLRLLGVRPDDHRGQALSQEELRTVVTEAGAMIPERSRDMLLAILNLEQATVEDIMVPRHEVEGIDLQDDDEDIINTIKRSNYARLPLFDGSIDDVIGIFHARSALDGLLGRDGLKDALRDLAREPYFVPEGTRLYQQLINFQRAKERVALIVDEYGDFQGMVTLADLVEEIVGEITTDPSDSFPDIHRNEDGSLLLDGGINVRELNRALRWELPTDGPKTLNGLILDYMETIPEPGTSLKLGGYPLEIIQADDTAVKMVKYVLPEDDGFDVAARGAPDNSS
jgi:Mg2+/Co2+ transporter CorB